MIANNLWNNYLVFENKLKPAEATEAAAAPDVPGLLMSLPLLSEAAAAFLGGAGGPPGDVLEEAAVALLACWLLSEATEAMMCLSLVFTLVVHSLSYT